jgi:hypothetical protein
MASLWVSVIRQRSVWRHCFFGTAAVNPYTSRLRLVDGKSEAEYGFETTVEVGKYSSEDSKVTLPV